METLETKGYALGFEVAYVVSLYAASKHFGWSKVQEAAAFPLIAALRTPVTVRRGKIKSRKIPYGLVNATKTFISVYLLRGDQQLIAQLSNAIGSAYNIGFNPQNIGLTGLPWVWGAVCLWDATTATDPSAKENELAKWVVRKFKGKDSPWSLNDLATVVRNSGKKKK